MTRKRDIDPPINARAIGRLLNWRALAAAAGKTEQAITTLPCEKALEFWNDHRRSSGTKYFRTSAFLWACNRSLPILP